MPEVGPVPGGSISTDGLFACCSAHINLKDQGITPCAVKTVRHNTPLECKKADAELQALLDTSGLPSIVQCYGVFTATTGGGVTWLHMATE